MSQDPFDYGGHDDSPARAATSLDGLDELLGVSGVEPRPKPTHNSLLAELDMRITLQVVVAVILLAAAGGLLAREMWARQARDTAYSQMLEASGRREYLRVMEGAEKFLTHQPLNGSGDMRAANAVNLYSEALVHWVAQQPDTLDDAARARVARHKQLVNSKDR